MATMTSQPEHSLPSRAQLHHGAPRQPWFKKLWVWVVVALAVVAVVTAVVLVNNARQVAPPQSGEQSGEVEESVVDPHQSDEGAQVEDPESSGGSEGDSATTNDSEDCDAAFAQAEYYAGTLYVSEAMAKSLLISPDGDGFSADAASCAIERLDWDWNANAIEKARLLSEDPDLTTEDIYDLLTSEHGELFTPAQAEHAVAQLGSQG